MPSIYGMLRPGSASKILTGNDPNASPEMFKRATSVARLMPKDAQVRNILIDKLEHIEREVFDPKKQGTGQPEKVLKHYGIVLTNQ